MCNQVIHKHLGTVQVDVTAGQSLRHTVRLVHGATGIFTLVDNAAQDVLLTSADAPGPNGPAWVSAWPAPGFAPGKTTQALLTGFVAANRYRWTIDVLDGNGNVIDTPLDVEYVGADSGDHCFDAISVAVDGAI